MANILRRQPGLRLAAKDLYCKNNASFASVVATKSFFEQAASTITTAALKVWTGSAWINVT